MYHRTLDDFFRHEISEMHRNIDRIQHGLDGRNLDDERLTGQLQILQKQKDHLHFLEQLQMRATTYDDAIAICRQCIIANEQAHSDIANRENGQTISHSPEWWNTLHDAQFVSDVMHRIQSWQKMYAVDA